MKHDTPTTPELVAFADLHISDLNPRTVFGEGAIETLAANIREHGLIQNLAGEREVHGKIGIVAGGRRLRALALLQDDPRFQVVPVIVAPDRATAKVWASSENHLREQPHPADEIREYGRMASKGTSVPSIALAFGVTEAHVYRRLKLANLPEPVLDALKTGDITLGNAAAFTISEDEPLSLTVLDRVRGQGYSDHQIKQLLKPDAVRESDRRALFVGQAEYEAAGGRSTRDLFAEQTYFEDVTLLQDLFEVKLNAATGAAKQQGWSWAEALPTTYVGYYEIEDRKLSRIYAEPGDLTKAETERYDTLAELAEGEVIDAEGEAELAVLQAMLDGTFSDAQKAVSGVLIYVDHEGRLQRQEGLVRKEDKAAAITAGFLRTSAQGGDSDRPKSPISQKLREDLNRIALGARQHALLQHPDLLVDLLAYQLSHALHWENPLGLTTTDVPNWPSTEAEGYALDERLTSNPPRDMYGKDLAKSFRAFRRKGREHMRGELTRYLAAQFKGSSKALSHLVDKEVSASIRAVWTPTAENFFSRVGGPYLNALWQDLLELPEDHPTVTTFAKLKKGEKAAKLEKLFSDDEMRQAQGVTEAQAARIDAWLPEGME